MNETPCTDCGSDVGAHQSVYVAERTDDRQVGNESENRSGNDVHADDRARGEFCNYACLSAYIDEEELVYGSACSFDPSG